jgi:chromosome segregation ATPase
MARIFDLFSLRTTAHEASDDDLSTAAGRRPAPNTAAAQASSVSVFGSLAESQRSIDDGLSTVLQGLSSVQSLVSRMLTMQGEVQDLFEKHRASALANAALEQEREHLQSRLREKSAEAEATMRSLNATNAELDTVRSGLQKKNLDYESLEHRLQVMGIAKKDADEQAASLSSQLIVAQEELDGIHLEANSLRQQAERDAVRLDELTARTSEQAETVSLLTHRCEAQDVTLQARADEVINLKQQVELLSHEHVNAQQYASQKDRELAQAKLDLSKLFEKYQADIKAKESDINQLRREVESCRASIRMLEQINADLKTENDRLTIDGRQIAEDNKRQDVALSRLESKAARLASNLEASNIAKNHVEQARSALAARLEAATDALRGRDSDVRRLEGDVSRLMGDIEEQNALHRATVESLNDRVFELERDLTSQANEAAFLPIQNEGAKRSD